MIRKDFIGFLVQYIIRKSHSWLPEESTEVEMLNVFQKRFNDHVAEIRKVLINKNV